MPDFVVADFRQSLCRRRLGIRRQLTRFGQGPVEEQRSDWRRAVAVVSERRVAQGRALYTERSPAELYRGPGAASASVTLGLGVPGNLLRRISGVSRRADSERSGPPPAPAAPVITKYWIVVY